MITLIILVWLIVNLIAGYLTWFKHKIDEKDLWVFTGVSSLIMYITLGL